MLYVTNVFGAIFFIFVFFSLSMVNGLVLPYNVNHILYKSLTKPDQPSFCLLVV